MSQAIEYVRPPVLDRVFGQEAAVALLASSARAPVESYLFVGPSGSGKRDAALAFAAALVCPFGGCGTCSACREALAERHPDVTVIERSGASISVDEARAVAALAQRTPTAATRQVIILVDFHLVSQAAPALLKTIEEPPPSTTFVVLAENVPPALVTVASRCLRVVFTRLSPDAIVRALVADGVSEEAARRAADGAAGRLDRARLLALDEGFVARQSRWKLVPERLDGSGATIAVLAAELIAAADELVAVLKEQQSAELAALSEASANAGERRLVGLSAIEDRHRREQRRVRADELRAGFAILAGAYRARLATPGLQARRIAALLKAIDEISAASATLVRNPNESLLVQSLLVALDGAS
jgi:DNA polymerase III subunit delta'